MSTVVATTFDDPDSKFSLTWWARRRLKEWRRYLGHLKGQPLSMLEIGVYEGYTGCWFFEEILTHPDCRYTGVDTWRIEDNLSVHHKDDELGRKRWALIEQRARRNLTAYGNRATVVKLGSVDYLRSLWPEPRWHIIYVDGSHTFLGAANDMMLCWPMLYPGGYMLVDDLKFQKGRDKEVIGCALDRFLLCTKGQYELVLRQAVGIVRKL
jgi:predicted O-methyltransferase YrrM